MTTYELFLESGPKRRKTMVHVPGLLGCVAVGPTTEDALAATPDAIRAYLRFVRRHGEAADPDAPFDVRVVEHVTEGDWLGNGSPYVTFASDLSPVTAPEIETYVSRLRGLCGELAAWADRMGDEELDASPTAGRTGRAILLHVLGAQGAYLSPVLGGAPGFSSLHGAAERGELPIGEALRRAGALGEERIRGTSAEQRSLVREQPAGTTRTLRKAIRRMLEHDWEHLAELARRPGGPDLS